MYTNSVPKLDFAPSFNVGAMVFLTIKQFLDTNWVSSIQLKSDIISLKIVSDPTG